MTYRKKTVLRTIRLTQHLDKVLQEDAESEGISINALISKIFTRYADWDRHVDKFGFIQMAKATFRCILEMLEEEEVARIADQVASETVESITLFWFKEANVETLLQTASLIGRYSNLYRSESELRQGKRVISLHHDLGRKWSIFLRRLFIHVLEKALKVAPDTEVRDDSMVISL